MIRYKNLSGGSGVVFYEIEAGRITIKFNDGWNYLYSAQSTSNINIQEMARLATQGYGLNSFITRVVGKGFVRKWQ
jgi:hypothetical protein